MGGLFDETFDKVTKKKLRNRLSAQRARDRQKARMQLLETEVQYLTNSNKMLQRENELLRNFLRNNGVLSDKDSTPTIGQADKAPAICESVKTSADREKPTDSGKKRVSSEYQDSTGIIGSQRYSHGPQQISSVFHPCYSTPYISPLQTGVIVPLLQPPNYLSRYMAFFDHFNSSVKQCRGDQSPNISEQDEEDRSTISHSDFGDDESQCSSRDDGFHTGSSEEDGNNGIPADNDH